MAVNIHNLIAAINPDIYCQASARSEVKALVKAKGYLAAAEKAKPLEAESFDPLKMKTIHPWDKLPLRYPVEKHQMRYNTPTNALEQIYFWFLDRINTKYQFIDKIVDNFVAAPGSANFSEVGMKATKMQEEAMKMLGATNQVIKAILNLIYDLREFKLRLAVYDDYRSSNKQTRANALLSLKQIWMDNVDIKRGNTSIKGMAQQFDYVTLIDAFMAVEDAQSVEKMDLNDRVKRLLSQRMTEFGRWIDESERELRKRFDLEKMYLQSQMNTVKLYARWIKPYLKAAKSLEQNARPTESLVNVFNANVSELVVLGYKRYKIEDEVLAGNLSKKFMDDYELKEKRKELRTMFFTIILEMRFTSIPERPAHAGGGSRGKLELWFTSYVLTNEEMEVLKDQLEKDDFRDAFGAIEGATSDSISKLETDVNDILNSKLKETPNEPSADVNPFSALFSFLKKKEVKPQTGEKKKLPVPLKPDTPEENVVRARAILKARGECLKVYNDFKKANNIPAF